MIHAYYVTETGIHDDVLWGTNHGNEPFEGSVNIPTRHIVAFIDRHFGSAIARGVGPRDPGPEPLPGAHDDTWVADLWLTNGDHIWLYGPDINTAATVVDQLSDHRRLYRRWETP